MLAVLRAGAGYPARFDPGKWGERPWHLVIPEWAVRVAAELRDHAAAGSACRGAPLLGDGSRTAAVCLTRSGELVTSGRLSPAVTDGRSPEEIDRVLGCWQRLLSGLDSDTRLYFHLLRRPVPPAAGEGRPHRGSRGSR